VWKINIHDVEHMRSITLVKVFVLMFSRCRVAFMLSAYFIITFNPIFDCFLSFFKIMNQVLWCGSNKTCYYWWQCFTYRCLNLHHLRAGRPDMSSFPLARYTEQKETNLASQAAYLQTAENHSQTNKDLKAGWSCHWQTHCQGRR